MLPAEIRIQLMHCDYVGSSFLESRMRNEDFQFEERVECEAAEPKGG